jgi:hypothetical protein
MSTNDAHRAVRLLLASLAILASCGEPGEVVESVDTGGPNADGAVAEISEGADAVDSVAFDADVAANLDGADAGLDAGLDAAADSAPDTTDDGSDAAVPPDATTDETPTGDTADADAVMPDAAPDVLGVVDAAVDAASDAVDDAGTDAESSSDTTPDGETEPDVGVATDSVADELTDAAPEPQDVVVDAATDGGPAEISDAAPVACTLSDDCPADQSYCSNGVCVACVMDAHCAAPGSLCTAGTCSKPIPCASDKVCLVKGLVCDFTVGACVGCLTSDDCTAPNVCTNYQCVPPPVACTSSKICAPNICQDGFCAECGSDPDCGKTQWCSAGVCLPDVCQAGMVTCSTTDKASTCADNGSAWLSGACPANTVCEASSCQAVVCAAGASGCTNNSAWTCNGFGTAQTSTDCGNDAVCVGGTCKAKLCATGSALCDGPNLQVCNSDGTAYDPKACADGTGCVNGVCTTWQCTPNSNACLNGKLTACDGSGQWSATVEDCGANSAVCMGGVCVPSSCTAGVKQCADDTTLLTCNVTGTGWDAAKCPSNKVCDQIGCATLICTPDAKSCSKNSAQTCNAKGTDYVSATDCGLSGSACVDGVCLPVTCTPTASECDGLQLATCNSTGTAWTTASCGASKACDGGACVSLVCTANSTQCVGSLINVCNGSGTAWMSGTDCGGLGQICVNGACTSQVCTPNTKQCSNGQLQTCDSQGLSWTTTSCGASSTCVNNACAAVVCTANATSCVNSVVSTCNGTGTGSTAGVDCAASGQQCVSGTCVTPTCVANSKTCSANAVLTCKADGTGYTSLTCDDGNPCTVDTCNSGTKACAYAAMPCDDGNTCTTDSCLGGACTHASAAGSCNDGKACSTGEICSGGSCVVPVGTVSTLAGSSTSGIGDGVGAAATLTKPGALVRTTGGGFVFIDYSGRLVRKVMSDGTVKTVAGTTGGGAVDGPASTSTFQSILGVATAQDGSIWLADAGNNKIRRLSTDGLVSTMAGSTTAGIADGTGTVARFNAPGDIAVDRGGVIWVADTGNNRIRRVSPSGVVVTVAGSGIGQTIDGTGLSASFFSPCALAVGGDGLLYIADCGSGAIRSLTSAGVVTTLSGGTGTGYADGSGSAAKWGSALRMAWTSAGLVISDGSANRLRKLTFSGMASTLSSNATIGFADGSLTTAQFYNIAGIAVDNSGSAYLADASNYRIRKISLQPVVCDDGSACTLDTCGASGCTFTAVADASACDDGSACTSADGCLAGACTGVVNTCDDGNTCTSDYCNPLAGNCETVFKAGICDDGTACTGDDRCSKGKCGNGGSTVSTLAGGAASGMVDDWTTAAKMNAVTGIVGETDGSALFADSLNNRIRRITADGKVTTVAGGVQGYANGSGTNARFYGPSRIVKSTSGTYFITDSTGARIRKMVGNAVSTFAGTGVAGFANGAGTSAQFKTPVGIGLGADGTLYVADQGNQRIRAIAADGTTSTFAGTGTAGTSNGTTAGATFNSPTGLCIDPVDGTVYVTESLAHEVRKISGGVVTTLAGKGMAAGFIDAIGSSARFNYPVDCVVGSDRAVLVADQYNNRIRRIRQDGTVTTLAGTMTPPAIPGIAPALQTLVDGAPTTTATFQKLSGLGVDVPGRIWIADNFAIRRFALAAVDCDDGVPCTADACDATTGGCTHTTVADGSPCTGSNPCVVSTTCLSGKCIGGAAKNCDDANPCTLDGCTAGTGVCAHDGLDQACTDGDACTLYDWCANGQCNASLGWVTTLAGLASTTGFADGTGGVARFANAYGLAFGSDGSAYISDMNNYRIRRVMSDGTTSTVAGTGTFGYLDGAAVSAQFSTPAGITSIGPDTFAVIDTNRVRKIVNGNVTTLAGQSSAGYFDGVGTAARFNVPWGIAAKSDGTMYVADSGNNRIRSVTIAGTVTTFAGGGGTGGTDGAASTATFNGPRGVCVAPNGAVYVADTGNNLVRRIWNGSVATVAGYKGQTGTADGQGNTARFNQPIDCDVAPDGSVYVMDNGNFRIRRVDVAGNVTTVAGFNGASGTGAIDGSAADALFASPWRLRFDPSGVLWVGDGGAVRQYKFPAVNCTDGLPCTSDLCDSVTGQCSNPPAAATATCDDGNPCTMGETCGGGTCGNGGGSPCDDGDACTTDSCNSYTGCAHGRVVSASCCTTFSSKWGFESTDTNWTVSPSASWKSSNSISAHEGTYALVSANALTTVQVATLTPTALPNAPTQLKFWVWNYDYLTCSGTNGTFDTANDSLQIVVNGNVAWALNTGATLGAWIPALVDLTPYAGQTVTIELRHQKFNAASCVGLAVDDLSISGYCQ